MKIYYSSLAIVLSFILFQFLNCSTEPIAPDQSEVTTTVITGKVNELTQSGPVPLTNCKVSLIATNTTTISYTDSNGVFLDTLVNSDASFRLKIEKAGFTTIDTLLQKNQVNSLSFTMNISIAFISGSVTENTQTSTQPSDSCKISIITTTETILIYSDPNGNFSSDISTTDITFRLLLEKDGFNTIDTTVQSSAAQNLNFTINYNRIEVSGRLYKVDSSGTFCFPNCEMKIYSGGVENLVQSDDDGYFILITETFDDMVRITIDKNLYTKIDTTVAIQSSTDLELTLTELVYYFPLVVGSNWIYKGYYGFGEEYYDRIIGEENWELTELAPDSTWFKITTIFNGALIKYWYGDPYDTTYIYNEIATIKINNINGNLYYDSVVGSNISLLNYFFGVLGSVPFGGHLIFADLFSILYPFQSSNPILINYDEDFQRLTYRLTINFGFTYLFCSKIYAMAGAASELTLVSYDIP